LTAAEREELATVLRRRHAAQGLAQRARIVLRCADGLSSKAVAGDLAVCAHTVGKWRERYARDRFAGLTDAPRSGAPRRIDDIAVAAVVTRTLEAVPADARQWSTRSMAKACGLSVSTVGRIWRAFGLQPHRSETFKLSSDPAFVEKVRDIVGLYLNPPDRAVVLCVDQKTQIQALDRTLPLRPDPPERRTHDDQRHGTASLFAALDVTVGSVIGRCFKRHRAIEFRCFLDDIDANVPPQLDVHIVLDNASSHKTKLIHNWLPGGRATICISLRARLPGSIRSSASSPC
jgi:transposase